MTRRLVFLAVAILFALTLNTLAYADSVRSDSVDAKKLLTPAASAPDVGLRNLNIVKSARLVPKDSPAFLASRGGVTLSTSSSSSSSEGTPRDTQTPTPEPLSMILLGTGLAAGAAAIRKSRS